MSRDPAPVCRGVAFLDEHVPGWENDIDLEELDLQSKERCVLGQLWLAQHPRTRIVSRAYESERKRLGLSQEDAAGLGFNLPVGALLTVDDGEYQFLRLTKAWKRVIRRRLRKRLIRRRLRAAA